MKPITGVLVGYSTVSSPTDPPAASLIPYGGMFSNETDIPPECMIVVDAGYSFTHVIPIRGGDIVWEHVKR